MPSLCGALDDEPEAREVAATVLRHHGAIVLTVADEEQAFREFSPG